MPQYIWSGYLVLLPIEQGTLSTFGHLPRCPKIAMRNGAHSAQGEVTIDSGADARLLAQERSWDASAK
jgi:hypothetical protein